MHSVVKYNNKYILSYEGTDRYFPSRFAIGIAYSDDGIKWQKSKINPIIEGGPVGSWDSMGAYHPSLLIENDRIIMFYVGLDNAYNHQIGVAEINPYYLLNNE